MSFRIQGKHAFVTGANRGIGEAIVDALVAAGAAKVYAAARNKADLAPLTSRHGDVLVPVELDVTDARQIEAAVEQAPDVHILVNNAGVAAHSGGAFTDPAWIDAGRKEMEVNFFGTFRLTQAFAPVLAANGGGAVVNLASVASLVGFPLFVAYSASKAATHSLTQSTRIMLKSQGTRVFGVYPGPIDTRMAEPISMDKAAPADAARAIVDGIEQGIEEIFPDPASQNMGNAFLQSPKALERQIAAGMTEA